MAVPVLVVNRAQDTERWEGFVKAAEAVGVAPERVSAFDAHRPDFPFAVHADQIGAHFWGEADVKPGAIGCFLSHRRAWQHLLESGADHALICEDDTRLVEDTARLEALIAARPEVDLIFANDRMAAWSDACAAAPTEWCALSDVMAGLQSLSLGDWPKRLSKAPGADCYLMSRTGAEKLLARTTAHKIVCGVDWALVSAGLGREHLSITEPEGGDADQGIAAEIAFCASHLVAPEPVVHAIVLAEPVARLDRTAPSVLKHAVTLPIADLTQTSSVLAHTEYVSTLRLGRAELAFAGRSGNDPVMAIHREGRLWESDAIAALLANFPEGGVFVDVGAHLGNHSVAVARLGAASRVVAVEPNKEITRLLEANLAMNGLTDRIEIIGPGQALGREEGSGWLVRNRRKSSESMVKSDLSESQREEAEEVSMLTGDGLLSGQRVDAIKINTSGSEVEVLKGLGEVLSEQRPLLLVAHTSGQEDRLQRVLDEYGYRLKATFESDRKNRCSSLMVPAPRRDAGQ